MNRKFWPGIFLFVVLFMGVQCGDSGSQYPANKVVCILFDLSESTNLDQVRQAYAQTTRTILRKMHRGDVLVAALITEKSISELRFGVQYEFPLFKPSTDNPLYRQAEEQKAQKHLFAIKDSLARVVDSILYHPERRIMNTEILSALQVVERVFKSYPQPRKVLVIMSDMVEDSDFYDFDRERLTDQRIIRIIEQEGREGRLPDLKGAKVYVIGAMARKTQRFMQIRKFWMTYFKTCGAQLAEENYGPTLIRFAE